MTTVLALHVIFVFIWVGTLMTLTRFMGYHVKEDEHVQMRLAKIYHRIYNFVELPSMVVALLLGVGLMTHIDFDTYDLRWFFLKLIFVVGLVVCDVITGSFVKELNQAPDTSKGIKYKVLHGIVGLCLIGAIFSIFYFNHSC